jgi:DNA-binding Xre family transcriptional regulator
MLLKKKKKNEKELLKQLGIQKSNLLVIETAKINLFAVVVKNVEAMKEKVKEIS